jgi:ribonuclease E
MPMDGQPVEQMQNGHMPVEHAPYDASPPPVMDAPAPAPVMMAPPEPVFASAPQPAPAPAPEPEPVPVPVTILPTISADAPPEKPKRGWWRR